jgi:AcrR family transcriptional regulator
MEVKEQKKNDIAKAARELFTDFGYRSVSMEQIANRSNVAKGTLYLYFKDKEALFYYLADQFRNDMKSFISSVEQKKLSPIEELHEIIYNLLMYRRNQKFLYKVRQEAMEFKTSAACHVEKMIDDEIAGYIAKRLDDAMEKGLMKKCNPSVLSFIVIKVYGALAFEWEENHEPLNERQIADFVSLFLVEGLINKTE